VAVGAPKCIDDKGADVPLFCWAVGATVMRDVLIRLLEPTIESMNYELIDVELAQAGRGVNVRLYIDNAAGITVDDCAHVSHAVSEVLDVEDPIKGHYMLEVSSPGFDRVLRKPAHFARFVGERVAVELKLPLDGRRRFSGTLKSMSDGAIVVEVDGTPYVLPLERIQKAKLKSE
jgi:ribosome maturation factor RimP